MIKMAGKPKKSAFSDTLGGGMVKLIQNILFLPTSFTRWGVCDEAASGVPERFRFGYLLIFPNFSIKTA
jgi:hypothetical protein